MLKFFSSSLLMMEKNFVIFNTNRFFFVPMSGIIWKKISMFERNGSGKLKEMLKFNMNNYDR